MSLTNQKQKDAAMAAYLKKMGVKRATLNCAICHHSVGRAGYENHLRTCKGREK